MKFESETRNSGVLNFDSKYAALWDYADTIEFCYLTKKVGTDAPR